MSEFPWKGLFLRLAVLASLGTCFVFCLQRALQFEERGSVAMFWSGSSFLLAGLVLASFLFLVFLAPFLREYRRVLVVGSILGFLPIVILYLVSWMIPIDGGNEQVIAQLLDGIFDILAFPGDSLMHASRYNSGFYTSELSAASEVVHYFRFLVLNIIGWIGIAFISNKFKRVAVESRASKDL